MCILSKVIIRQLGEVYYSEALKAMQTFTECRHSDTCDEIWLLQHPPVFTLGRNGKDEHVLVETDIPIVQSDRGGDITYHGPGQVIAYVLIDLKRRKQGVRQLVNSLVDVVIKFSLNSDFAGRHHDCFSNNLMIGETSFFSRRGINFCCITF